jgi:hypothetical protein
MQGYPIGPPPTREKPPRGGFFTSLLVLTTVGAFFGMAGSFLALAALKKGLQHGDIAMADVPRLKKLAFILMGASALQLACAAGMWMWKRWGVYGYVGLATLSVILSMRMDPGRHVPYGDILRICCVLAAAVPKWSHFDD